MVSWGAGGGYGEALLCGAVAAACTAVNLVAGKKEGKGIVHDIYRWYEQTPLPSDITQNMANQKKFPVEKYKSTEIFKQTTAGSAICHISVTRFCKENGFESGSKQRSERCARVTADMAHYVATRLNILADSKYEKELAIRDDVQECRTCHSKGKPFDDGGWTRGKSDCMPCHGQDIDVSTGHYSGFDKR